MEAEPNRCSILLSPRQISEVYSIHRNRFIVRALQLVGNRSDAEDLVQKAFEIALKKPISTVDHLKYFVLSAIYYLFLHYRRKMLKEVIKKEAFEKTLPPYAYPDISLRAYAIFEEMEKLFGRPLEDIFEFFINGFTQKEIAAKLSLHPREMSRKMAVL